MKFLRFTLNYSRWEHFSLLFVVTLQLLKKALCSTYVYVRAPYQSFLNHISAEFFVRTKNKVNECWILISNALLSFLVCCSCDTSFFCILPK